ncbi:MAG: hypothetical protein DMG21_04460 [Acidobacteria bacterium]|nr:MAG: hypothetical protein DMG21_04460 [Acidobacteriota bacterium]
MTEMKSLTRRVTRSGDECGLTLIETLIAVTILIVVASGLLILFTVVVAQNEAQGDLATRTTEYSQDKMELLITLAFNDPALGGTMAASSTVGSVPPTAPVTNYVDYLDINGNVATSATAEYTRQWSISTDSTASLKTITVVVTSLVSRGPQGKAPSTTVVCVKSNGL